MSVVNWTERWMALAMHVSSWSKDESSQVGVVVVGENKRLLTLGYNGLPRGVDESFPSRHERPEKYFWYEHAERNACYNAAADGIAFKGATMYAPNAPCCDCARAVIQSGISRVVYYSDGPFFDRPDWVDNLRRSLEMFTEGGVKVTAMAGYPK